jgi:LPXTG-site transpeptidase (sortase) family protein
MDLFTRIRSLLIKRANLVYLVSAVSFGLLILSKNSLFFVQGEVLGIKTFSNILNLNNSSQEIVEKESVFAKSLSPIYAPPVRLYSDRNLIDLALIEVGVEENGTMEAPKDWNLGGWFYRSSKPGQRGNIIVNGHYDDEFGRPAAFYQLKNLTIGDRVFLVDEFGRNYPYQITEIFYIDIDDPNRLTILEDVDDNSELTLITCGGVWIENRGYNQRLVVKATLIP